MSDTLFALLGFAGWALALLVLMELVRSFLVVTRQVPANRFDPSNASLSPFMQRLARAHANCIEGLPIFGAILIVAVLTGKANVTDALAYPFLVARIVQSCIHLVSTSAVAVILRFSAFTVQMAIAAYWVVRLYAA